MELNIERLCHVQKRMQTSADKSGDDEIVTCRVGVKGVRVHRDQMEELGGLPIGATAPLFTEAGMPIQRMSFLFPKRELIAAGKIEHRRESGATNATLQLTTAVVADLRFNLDVPEEDNETCMMSFTLVWKAAGDEVDEVRGLLNRKGCWMKMKFREPELSQQSDAFAGGPKAEAAAGAKAKQERADRKRLAAGETPEEAKQTPPPAAAAGDDELLATAMEYVKRSGRGSVSAVQRQLKIGYNRAARIVEALEVLKVVGPLKADGTRDVLERIGPKKGGLAELERDAKAHAAKHPRKDPKTTPTRRTR